MGQTCHIPGTIQFFDIFGIIFAYFSSLRHAQIDEETCAYDSRLVDLGCPFKFSAPIPFVMESLESGGSSWPISQTRNVDTFGLDRHTCGEGVRRRAVFVWTFEAILSVYQGAEQTSE
ncbi:hypothetical protein PM082_022385 [Marasmius tenuissimus]|nr:hypothetical protein PM082_022385 [Marasmius tenuissimus]